MEQMVGVIVFFVFQENSLMACKNSSSKAQQNTILFFFLCVLESQDTKEDEASEPHRWDKPFQT